MRGHPFVGLTVRAAMISICAIVLCAALPARAARRAADDDLGAYRIFTGHADGIHALAFFPDGKRLVSASHDKTLRIWDLQNGRLLRTLAGHEGPVWCLDVSADGKRIASAGDDMVARVWDADTGEIVAQLPGHTRSIRGIGFLPGNRLLTGAEVGDGTVRLWDLNAEKEIWRIPADDCVLAMAFNADRSRVAFGGCDGFVKVWDLAKRRRLSKFGIMPSHIDGVPVLSLALSADGLRVACSDANLRLGLWDADTGAELPAGRRASIQVQDGFAADAQLDRFGTMRGMVFNVHTGLPVATLSMRGSAGEPSAAAFSADGRWLAIASGGQRRGARGWKPGDSVNVLLFRTPAPAGTVSSDPASPRDGGTSWEPHPVTVRQAGKPDVPLAAHRNLYDWSRARSWQIASTTDRPAVKANAPPVDLLVNEGIAVLHRQLGTFEVIVHENDGTNVGDVVWDGERFWLSSYDHGLMAVDLDGGVIARLGQAQGVPQANAARVPLYALGPGRILAAGRPVGNKPGASWCVCTAPDPSAPCGFSVTKVFDDTKLPADWRYDFSNGGTNDRGAEALLPCVFIGPPRAAGAPNEVWLLCEQSTYSPRPILRLNVQDFTATSFSLAVSEPPHVAGQQPRRLPIYSHPAGIGIERPPLWLGDGSHLLALHNHDVFVATYDPSKPRLEQEACRFVCSANTDDAPPTLLRHGDAFYVVGDRWYQVDPQTFAPHDLGPVLPRPRGFSSDGSNGAVTYFFTALGGPCAIDWGEGNLCTFSLDPARPLPTHALPPKAPAMPQPVPDAGEIQYNLATVGPDSVTFLAGLGELSFLDGKLVTPAAFREGRHLGTRVAEASHGLTVGDVSGRLARFAEFPAERARIRLSEVQYKAVRAAVVRPGVNANANSPFAPSMRQRVEKLYADYAGAKDDATRGKAANALFTLAKVAGDEWMKEADDYFAHVRKAFTDDQWAAFIGKPW